MLLLGVSLDLRQVGLLVDQPCGLVPVALYYSAVVQASPAECCRLLHSRDGHPLDRVHAPSSQGARPLVGNDYGLQYTQGNVLLIHSTNKGSEPCWQSTFCRHSGAMAGRLLLASPWVSHIIANTKQMVEGQHVQAVRSRHRRQTSPTPILRDFDKP